MITVKNLLHSLVTHLSGGEALQRHDGRVGPVAQQQLAGLDVTGQCGSVESCLTERVHGVHLQSEQATLTRLPCYTRRGREETHKQKHNTPLLRASAAPPGYHCELSQQQRAGGS